MTRRKKKRSPVFVVSVLAHLAVGAVLAFIPQDKLREVVAIALSETPEKKKVEPPKPEPHKERPAQAPGRNLRPAAARAEPTPAAANAPVFTDIGIALDSSSADGLAINIARPVEVMPKKVEVAPSKPKVLVARPVEVECTEEIVKPRPLSMVRPAYTDAARRAHVEGRVRVEVFVNERGEVTETRVRSGLGYGLDEAAVGALSRIVFSPATRCGKPIASSLIIGMRFALGT